MREYSSALSKVFTNGLRKDIESARNSLVLTQSKFLIPRNGTLVPAEDITDPLGEAPTIVWPFPQLFLGKDISLLAYDDSVNEVDSLWEITPFTIYDLATDNEATISGAPTEPWHFVDAYKTWMLLRPTCSIIRTNYAGMFGETNKVYHQDNMTINTGTAFRGRILIGGFNPTNFWNIEWEAFLAYWSSQFSFSIDASLTMGKNFVMWSAIGGGNVIDIFLASRGVEGVIEEVGRTANDSMYLDYMRRNDFGFMPMTFRGEVQMLKELGNGVVAYGEDGISALIPVTSPEPTFGLKKIADFGILRRSAVGGNENQHAFLDCDGDIWTMEADYIPHRLGYKEFFSGFSIPVITFDERRKEFHITDEDESYVLTEQGLGQEHQFPSSLYRYDGALIGVAEDSASTEVLIVTDVVDFGVRDVKTVTTVEVGITTDYIVYVAADYRYKKDEDFTRSSYILVNDEGFARLQISALEFRFVVKITNFTGASLDYLNIHWQLSGKRTIRGMYDNPTNA